MGKGKKTRIGRKERTQKSMRTKRLLLPFWLAAGSRALEGSITGRATNKTSEEFCFLFATKRFYRSGQIRSTQIRTGKLRSDQVR